MDALGCGTRDLRVSPLKALSNDPSQEGAKIPINKLEKLPLPVCVLCSVCELDKFAPSAEQTPVEMAN